MKKIILALLFIFFIQNTVFAHETLSFIYINGSNNNNKKMSNWYRKGVQKLHPVLRKKILSSKKIKKWYSNNENFTIEEKPIIFFWGNKSKKELDFLKDQIDISKAITAYGAYMTRSIFSESLHDAIWVQKPHNMTSVLHDLNNYVKREAQCGKKVVLYGYSAGTFVTYEYLLLKLRYINLYDYFSTLNTSESFMKFIKENPRKNTCISAMTQPSLSLGTLAVSGHIVPSQNIEQLKKIYMNIDKQTELYCAPENTVKGIVNFASPFVLFYSDLADPDYHLNYYNKLLTKYIFENGMFNITVNFREDPFGFPLSRNMTVLETSQKINMQINDPSGVIYDNSGVWSRKSFLVAHTSYWTAKKALSNGVVKTFENGYRFQYDSKYQKRMLKKRNKSYKKKKIDIRE